MNLLDLAVKITCDDQASGEVGKIGDGVKKTLGTAAKVGGAAVAAIGTATVAIGKKALDAYADYEQLAGGIDTLFKGSAAKVKAYAKEAYKSAGVSANRYMEITTSFAASLISSLGGDTAKAAEMADMAVRDMSDNANKMGTAVETVQEVYQSLARGNYEMLDSLKLGYGGTKEELKRLLADAEKFAAAQGEVRDFSIDSYADIVEAIHIVQDEMGITGTTAKEAEQTISGSINAMKASWDNWLAGLGNSDVDMTVLTDELVGSVITVGNNVIPRMGEIMGSLGQVVRERAPDVAMALREALISLLPEAVQGPIREAFAGVDGTLAGLFEAIGSGVQIFSQAVNDLVLPAIEQLSPAFEYFFEAIQNAQPLLELIANIFGVVLASAISVVIQVLAGLVELAAIVINGLQQLYDGIAQFVQGVVTFFTVDLPNGIAALTQWFSELPGKIASFLSSIISNIGSWVGEMASGAVRAASQFASNLIDGLASIPGKVVEIGSNIIQGIVDGVLGAAQGLIDAVGNAVGNAIDAAKNLLGIHSPSRVFREIGRYTMQGMALGINDDTMMVEQSTDNAMRGMISSARDVDVDGVGGTSGTAAAYIVEAIEKLHRDLGKIIEDNAPTATPREFSRMVRAVI